MRIFTTTTRAAVVALAIAGVAAPAALAHDVTPNIVPIKAQHGNPAGLLPLITPTGLTQHAVVAPKAQHGNPAGLLALNMPTGSTERVAGMPPAVIIRSTPVTGFDWAAALIGAMVAVAAVLATYGAATAWRSRNTELEV
jgi:hypothetical protein